MQFSRLFLTIALAAISTTEACKCVINGSSYSEATQPCCSSLHGNYNSGNGDCAASSISEHLRNFRSCCSTWYLNNQPLTSDCDFPRVKSLAELEQVHTPQGEGVATQA